MVGRNTTIRDRHRATIRGRRDPCHICTRAIDYELPYLHPGSFVVDHVIPVNKGGPDTLDNKAASHRACNRTKSDKLVVVVLGVVVTVSTSRSW